MLKSAGFPDGAWCVATVHLVWCSSNITTSQLLHGCWCLRVLLCRFSNLWSWLHTYVPSVSSLGIVQSHLHTHCCILHKGPRRLLLLVIWSGGFYLHEYLRLFCDSHTTPTPRGWHTCSIFSLTPLCMVWTIISHTPRLVFLPLPALFCSWFLSQGSSRQIFWVSIRGKNIVKVFQFCSPWCVTHVGSIPEALGCAYEDSRSWSWCICQYVWKQILRGSSIILSQLST